MKSFIAFTNKEFLEYMRTYKALILISVFFIFGIMSPVIAKMMPDIVSNMSIKGMSLTVPKPTNIDAYSQFFKNISQMGFIVVLLIFSGVLSQELSKGTLINILSKGLPRHTVILSKYIASIFLWTVSYVISALTTYGYTIYLFGSSDIRNLFFSLLCMWLFGCFILSVILISSTLVSSSYGGLLISALFIGFLLILNIAPKLNKYNPITLASDNVVLLNNTVKTNDLFITIWITLALTACFLIASIAIFNKKKL